MKAFFTIFIFFASSITLASEKSFETSHLLVNDFSCKLVLKKIEGNVKTGNDLGGANYQLSFSGEEDHYQSFCDVLDLVKRKKSYVALKISHIKSVKETDTSSGTLEEIIFKAPND